MDYCRMQPCSIRALGDTALGIPELTRICKERIAKDAKPQDQDRRAQGGDRQAPRRGLGEVAGRGEEGLGRLADHVLAARARSLGRHQGRGLGAHRQRAQAPGAQAVGLRQALSPSRRRARHRDADRHLDRGRARAQGHRPAGGRHPARRRPDVRRRRALGRGQISNPDADRDAQQPRLLQRLGAPDPHGADPRHRRSQGAYRHGPVRPRAGLRRAGALDGLLRRRPDRQAGRTSGRRCCAPSPRSRRAAVALVDTITQHR